MEEFGYVSQTGMIVSHTERCATVQHFLGGGDRRGSSPSLCAVPMDEALTGFNQCGNCVRNRKARKIYTANGTLATPVEDEPLKWLVRISTHTWWVIELHNHDVRIEDINLDDFSKDSPWGAMASARKLSKKYDEASVSGWYVEVGSNSAEPYQRMQDAVDGMLAEIAQNRARRQQRATETTSVAAEDFQPGWRYWSVRPGYEDAWTIASVRIFPAEYQVQRDGKIITPTLVEHIRRDGDTRVFELGEKIAIQGPWKTEA